MEDGMLAVPCTPSLATRVRWAIGTFPRRARRAVAHWLLRLIVLLVGGESNIVAHGKRELRAGLAASKDSPDRWMADDLLQLLAVFSLHEHSGFSAPYCVSAFSDLARFQPLGPLTGEPDEWFDHGDGMFQNIRCSHVFKQVDRFNGQAYDIQGRIFREPNGSCWQNGDSHVPITFPYKPKTEYIDVPAKSDA